MGAFVSSYKTKIIGIISILFSLNLFAIGNDLEADTDYEWVDMESKDLYEALLESKKIGPPEQVYRNSLSLLNKIEQQEVAKVEKARKEAAYRRHPRCLLKNNARTMDILDMFKEIETQLKSSECKNAAAGSVKEFSDQVLAWQAERDAIINACAQQADAAGFMPRDREAFLRDCNNAPSYEALVTEKVGRASTALAKTVNTLACAEQITASDGLNTFGSLIGEVGQLGMVDPGPIGKTAAIGAKGVEGLIKVIANLVNSNWDFNKAEHRESWIHINCNFLELNNTIDKIGLLSPFTSLNERELRDSLRLSELLKEEIKTLNLSIAKVEENFSKEKRQQEEAILEKSLGSMTFDFYKRLSATEELLQTVAGDGSVIKDVKKRGYILKDLHQTYVIFFRHIDQIDIDSETRSLLLLPTKETFKDIFGPNVSQLRQITSKYLNNKTAYQELISSYYEPISWVKDELDAKLFELTKRNKSLEKPKIVAKLENTLSIVQDKLDDLEERIEVLQNKKKNIKGGKTALIEIIRIYNKLEDAIFGKVGVLYMERIIKKSSELIKKWYKTFTPLLDKPELVCKNSKNIKILYTELDSYVSTVRDILKINNYIYRQDTDATFPWTQIYKNYLSEQFFNSEKLTNLLKSSPLLRELKSNLTVANPEQIEEIKSLLETPDFKQPLTTMKKKTKVGNLILRRLLVKNDYARLAKMARGRCSF